jgi:hypothetical protein
MDAAAKELLNYGAVGLVALLAIAAVVALFKQLVAQRATAEGFKTVVESNTRAIESSNQGMANMAGNLNVLSESIKTLGVAHADVTKALIDKIK